MTAGQAGIHDSLDNPADLLIARNYDKHPFWQKTKCDLGIRVKQGLSLFGPIIC